MSKMSKLVDYVLRREPVDDVPVAIPVHVRRSESMDERIRRITEHSLSRAAADQGLETWEEANDFDIPDDPIDPETVWERDFEMATAESVDRGVVERPQLDPERLADIKHKVKNYKPPRPQEQIDLEDAIASAVARALKGSQEPSGA